jgi:hypothetical protein
MPISYCVGDFEKGDLKLRLGRRRAIKERVKKLHETEELDPKQLKRLGPGQSCHRGDTHLRRYLRSGHRLQSDPECRRNLGADRTL